MRVVVAALALLFALPLLRAQGTSCLVVPFENRSGNNSLDWIGESFVVALRAAVEPEGVRVLDRKQRQQALALVGAPAGTPLSLATEMRMADTADVPWLVAGWYDYDGDHIAIHAGVLSTAREHWVELAPEAGPLDQLEVLQARLGWALRLQIVPGATVGEASAPALPLSAYESYIRAQLAANPADQIRYLLAAQKLAPQDARVLQALGTAYFELGHDASALQWLAQVPAPQAQFTAGLAAYHLGEYARAVALFRPLAAQLPIPAVVQDLALAQAAARHQPVHGPLQTEFAADGFQQLAKTVAQFSAAKAQVLPPQDQAAAALARAASLQQQGALEAALQAYRAAAALPQADDHQRAEAHAGMAEICWARHDAAQAEKEVAAALAADPDNAHAQAVQAKLAPARRH